MCGLFLSFEPLNTHQMSLAFKAIRHRGFEETRYEDGRVSIGHTRLPIINIANGTQPANLQSSFAFLVGEIFNYKELYPNAETDTAVLCRILKSDGFQGLHKADGFWAGVFYNNYSSAFAFNDFLSIKPLYYSEKLKLVASEPFVFKAVYPEDLTPDPVFFSNVLKWGYDPTGRTPWLEVKQLPPGHYIGRDMIPIPYWDWRLVPGKSRSIRSELIEAVKNRLVGDRPVSLLLSGGLDSTIVFRILTRLLEHNDITVFHVENDENDALREALGDFPSRALITPLVTEEEAVRAFQAPVDAGSLLPQLALARAVAKEGFHVTLSGDGADELFGGYARSVEYDSQASDVFIELPHWHLPRLDRIMMAHTIELRSPYLAPRVVRTAMELPWEYRRGDKKALKNAFFDILPSNLLTRPKRALKSRQVREEGVAYRQRLIRLWEAIQKEPQFSFDL